MKIVTVVGARPQFIKSGPVSRSLRECHEEIVIHTGQHYDYNMSEIIFQSISLSAPKYNLGIGSGPHGQQTGRILEAVENILHLEIPDAIIVFGDTNSTIAAALAGSKMHIPIAHIEAGLRSFNRRMPEEINRVVTDHLSTFHFCPTQSAVDNLEHEGISVGVHMVGDVMQDALNFWSAQNPVSIDEILAAYSIRGAYYLATLHRQENIDDIYRLQEIISALQSFDHPVVLPIHPRTRAALDRQGQLASGGSIRIVEPVSYLEMLQLEQHAKVILTDSGGVQKEAYMLGVPCVTLRDETEWPETVELGWNRLVGASKDRIISEVLSASSPTSRPNLFGDGFASKRIADILSSSSFAD